MSNPTIGFIGYGNMAQAIAEGLVNAGTISGNDIVACAAHYDKLERNAAITEYAADQLGELVFVDLPEPGARVEARSWVCQW